MSYLGWNSKRDVLKDLIRVGQHGLGHALDEGHVVVGEQPPPLALCTPDEESELLMHKLCGGQPSATHPGVVKPDVAGISRYLRMIDPPDDEPLKEQEIKEKPQAKQTSNGIVVISKLNPNCKEFIPRFNVTCKTDQKEKEAPKKTDECVPMILDNDRIDINKKDVKEKAKCVPMILNSDLIDTNKKEVKEQAECVPMILDNDSIITNKKDVKEKAECVPMILNSDLIDTNKKEVKEKSECVPMILSNDRIDSNTKDAKEKAALEKKMKDKDLRKKIIDTSNIACPKITKDRNVAIVSLLKLHSQDPVCLNNNTNTGKRKEVCPSVNGGCNVATATVPILKTPAYYEKYPAQKCPEELMPPKSCKSKPTSLVSPAPIEKVCSTSAAKPFSTTDESILAAYVEQSVNKVQKWFQDSTNSSKYEINEDKIQNDAKEEEDRKLTTPEKQKGPMIHLGPFTYKRKSKPASPSNSSNSDSIENRKPKKEKCDEYKPSEYAEKLARKYTENNINMITEQGNIFTPKFLAELKARDEKILRERALAAARSQPQEQIDEASNNCVTS